MTMWRHLLNRWILLPIALLGLPIWFMARSLLELASDKFSAVTNADPTALDGQADSSTVRRLAANALHPVFVVSAPQQTSHDQATARLSAQLSAFGAPSAYPVLLVTTYGTDNKARRAVRLGAAEYEHGAAPASNGQPESVQFGIPITAQDAGFAVQAVNADLVVWQPGKAVGP